MMWCQEKADSSGEREILLKKETDNVLVKKKSMILHSPPKRAKQNLPISIGYYSCLQKEIHKETIYFYF
jgi:hypothetical protein